MSSACISALVKAELVIFSEEHNPLCLVKLGNVGVAREMWC